MCIRDSSSTYSYARFFVLSWCFVLEHNSNQLPLAGTGTVCICQDTPWLDTTFFACGTTTINRSGSCLWLKGNRINQICVRRSSESPPYLICIRRVLPMSTYYSDTLLCTGSSTTGEHEVILSSEGAVKHRRKTKTYLENMNEYCNKKQHHQ